ncbi:MAG: stage II sporulation protein M [Candidatus Aenigmatarchaeota archaeon]
MLEKLWLKEEIENKFLKSFLFSIFFTSLSISITHYFIPFKIMSQNYTGIIAVLIASLSTSYPLIRYLEKREDEEERMKNIDEGNLLFRHFHEILMYLVFFFGVTLSFSIFYFLFPQSFFSAQLGTIFSITGRFIRMGFLHSIVSNNLFVFFITFLLSFILSAGMVFILVWNASVLGVFFGKKIAAAGIYAPLSFVPDFLQIPWYVVGILLGPILSNDRNNQIMLSLTSVILIHGLMSYGIIGYMPHGILEIGSYCIAGISGFLLSRHVEDYRKEGSKEFLELSEDCFILLGIGLLMLFLGGVLEVL